MNSLLKLNNVSNNKPNFFRILVWYLSAIFENWSQWSRFGYWWTITSATMSSSGCWNQRNPTSVVLLEIQWLKERSKNCTIFLKYLLTFCYVRQFSNLKGGDLSQALIPFNDAAKLQNLSPVQDLSHSLGDMLTGKTNILYFYPSKLKIKSLKTCSYLF